MIKGKANVVLDGQWGSTGKGKLIGYLALRHDIAAVSCDFMSNAGHTFVGDDGNKMVTCQLPTSLVNRDAMLLINPGAAITVKRLLQEVEENGVSDRLFIHPHVAVITQDDRDHEAKVLSRISSTLKGCGGSNSRKIMRVAQLAKDTPELARWISDTTNITHSTLEAGGTILVEGAQGFDLSLNHGHRYPYVTSRDVTTMSILNNAGIPPAYLGDVYGCLRTMPIRVGHMYDKDGNKIGDSGPYYADHTELTWDEVTMMSGSPVSLIEKTTVTQKVRRVFTFSKTQLNRFIRICRPTKLFMNFINYINAGDMGKRAFGELSGESQNFVWNLDGSLHDYCQQHKIPEVGIDLIGTGPKDSEMIEVAI